MGNMLREGTLNFLSRVYNAMSNACCTKRDKMKPVTDRSENPPADIEINQPPRSVLEV